ncbi:MAG TPA: hypothetical protein VHC69_18570 [Polyangiaceae bacterium]|nr:hypothetical protein [Polyangiaceae bacterium]
MHFSKQPRRSSIPARGRVVCAAVIAGICAYTLLRQSGMQPADRMLLVTADVALMVVVSEILRERN